MQYKISIILPVYNVAKYLPECMESLVNQTLQDIEIITVNDGSPDNSIDILNDYQSRYPDMVKVYTTENKGVSHARNYGTDRASGEYIIYVDSDDFVDIRMCEILYNKAITDGNDIVLCNRYDINLTKSGRIIRKKINILAINQNFALKDCKFEMIKISPFPWDKMIKRSLLQNLRFEEDLRFEDLLFVHSLLPFAKSIGTVNEPLYCYRRTNSGGFLNSFSESTLDIITVFDKLIKLYQEKGIYDTYKEELEYICSRHLFIRYGNFFKKVTNDGDLSIKIQLIKDISTFMDEHFPNWKENHYMKYSSRKSFRARMPYYENKNKMIRYVKRKEKYPPKVLRLLEIISKIPQKFKKAFSLLLAGKLLKTIKRKINKTLIGKYKAKHNRFLYAKFIDTCQVDDHLIFLESKHGEDLAGNIFRMALSFTREEYKNYKIALAVRPKTVERIKNTLNCYGITNIAFLEVNSKEYLKALATAKYLVTDTSFPPYYLKRDEQKYLNTWHGTPLKYMGRIVPDREYGLGNVQRNYFIADYLLYQQEFSKNVFFEDYMLDDLFDGEVMLSGYPRNSAFYMENRYDEIRKEAGLEGKQVIVYMPTWRGTLNNKQNGKQIREITNYLIHIDMQLQDDQIFYVKLHPFVKSAIDCAEFLHIREIPAKYETYDFLNATDVLVTDYSSILFDFACSKRKIVLFTYDREDYLATRGIYIDFNALPFPACDTVESLISELRKPNEGYDEFYQEYCGYDSLETVDKVCDTLVLGKDTGLSLTKYDTKQTNNAFVYAPRIPVATYEDIVDGLNNYQGSKHLFFGFQSASMKKNSHLISNLDKKVGYIPMDGDELIRFKEKCNQYFAFYKGKHDKLTKNIDTFCARECKRRFGNIKFKDLVIYSSLSIKIVQFLSRMDVQKRIYAFKNFDLIRYEADPHYARTISQILLLIKDFDVVFMPTVMKDTIDIRVFSDNTKVFSADVVTMSDVLKEVE